MGDFFEKIFEILGIFFRLWDFFWPLGLLLKEFKNSLIFELFTPRKSFRGMVFFGKPEDQHPISVLHTVRADAGMIHLLFQDMLLSKFGLKEEIFCVQM